MATPASSIDMFVRIKGSHQGLIKGESTDTKHPGEILIQSYSWDVEQPYDKLGSGQATGKRRMGVFKFMAQTQASTPKLLTAATSGEVLTEVVITCRKAGKEQQEYLVWTLTNALLTRIDTGYLGDNDLIPHDKVELTFHKIQMTYKQQKADGTLDGGITFMDNWSELT